jgi:hypothetical protein
MCNHQVRPQGIRSRPFDFFVAFLVFFIGGYGFFDPDWPEKFDAFTAFILTVEDIYLVVASSIIMSGLVVNEFLIKKKCQGRLFVFSIVFQMFAWLFLSVAGWVIAISTPWIPPSVFAEQEGPLLWIWTVVWALFASGAWLRYRYIRHMTRSRVYE